jgi:hypothetical protein
MFVHGSTRLPMPCFAVASPALKSGGRWLLDSPFIPCLPIHRILLSRWSSLQLIPKVVAVRLRLSEWKYDGMCAVRRTGTTKQPNYSVGICWIPWNNTRMPSNIFPRLCSPMSSRSLSTQRLLASCRLVRVIVRFDYSLFQDLSTRRGTKQKNGRSVPIRIYAFDLLHLNGGFLMKQPLYERQKALRQHFRKTTGFAFVSSIVLARYDEALIQNCLKGDRARWGRGAKLTGREEIAGSELSTSSKTFGYESGTRDQLWLKLKRAQLEARLRDRIFRYCRRCTYWSLIWHWSKGRERFLGPYLTGGLR